MSFFFIEPKYVTFQHYQTQRNWKFSTFWVAIKKQNKNKLYLAPKMVNRLHILTCLFHLCSNHSESQNVLSGLSSIYISAFWYHNCNKLTRSRVNMNVIKKWLTFPIKISFNFCSFLFLQHFILNLNFSAKSELIIIFLVQQNCFRNITPVVHLARNLNYSKYVMPIYFNGNYNRYREYNSTFGESKFSAAKCNCLTVL